MNVEIMLVIIILQLTFLRALFWAFLVQIPCTLWILGPTITHFWQVLLQNVYHPRSYFLDDISKMLNDVCLAVVSYDTLTVAFVQSLDRCTNFATLS